MTFSIIKETNVRIYDRYALNIDGNTSFKYTNHQAINWIIIVQDIIIKY